MLDVMHEWWVIRSKSQMLDVVYVCWTFDSRQLWLNCMPHGYREQGRHESKVNQFKQGLSCSFCLFSVAELQHRSWKSTALHAASTLSKFSQQMTKWQYFGTCKAWHQLQTDPAWIAMLYQCETMYVQHCSPSWSATAWAALELACPTAPNTSAQLTLNLKSVSGSVRCLDAACSCITTNPVYLETVSMIIIMQVSAHVVGVYGPSLVSPGRLVLRWWCYLETVDCSYMYLAARSEPA